MIKKKIDKKTKKTDATQTAILILFHFLVFATPLFFTFNTSELFEFNKMVLTYGVTTLIVGAWLTRMVLLKQVIFKRTYLDLPILLFVISQFLSTIFSIHPATSFLGYYSRFHGGLVSTLTYVALYYAFVSNVEKKHLPSLFISMFTSGVAVAIYAALEHFGHSFSCYMVEGGKSFGVDCWIQDVKNRVFASFGQPNWLAAYMIMLLPVSIALVLQKKQKQLLRYIYAVASVLFLLVLLYTQSRSGFFGMVVGFAVFAGLLGLNWLSQKQQNVKEVLTDKLGAVAVLITGFVLVVAITGTPVSPSLSSLFQKQEAAVVVDTSATPTPVANRLDIGGTDSGEIRKIVWQGAIDVWKRYPILGSGVETFAYSYYFDRPMAHNLVSEWDFLYNKAHNEFLNFLATTGVVGLASYIALLGWFSYVGTKKIVQSKLSDPHTFLIIGCISGVAALSVSNFFGFSTVMVTVLMYLYFAILSVVNDHELDIQPISSKKSEVSYLLFSIITMASVFFLNMIYQYWKADVLYSKGKSYLDAGYFDQGMPLLQEAIKKNPGEATFYDELATQYSRYTVTLAQENQLQDAQTLMLAAVQASDATLKLNPRQLNFYKTRTGVFITLAQVQPALLQEAKKTLEEAIKLSPTDAKLIYNLGIVEISLENNDAGIANLEKAVEMKPNYEAARLQLANAYETADRKEEALEQLEYIVEKIAPQNQVALDKIASLSAEIK